ncbi:MAG TPA: 23S rRNA methyltransferase [Anaeromyxobacteraceae bacterium]|nr:23S rRNA methyltransferase [Anaeromyxobacteraceae bacterium]
MHPEVVAVLQCPCCRDHLTLEGRTLRCGAGHAFDLARTGYVNFVVGRSARVGDTDAMVSARDTFLSAGHFDPLSAELAMVAQRAGPGIAVELGSGTARHLSKVLDALPTPAGLAIDVSAAAARRAARAHPRVSAVVADTRRTLPVADGVAALAMLVFAPRNGAELRRIVRDDGALLVATPLPDHLAELRTAFDLIRVDAEKQTRLDAALSPGFARAESRQVRWEMVLTRSDCEALVAMGPSAHHLAAAAIAERAHRLPDATRVTGACCVEVWTPR